MTHSDDKSHRYFLKASSVLGMASAFSPALNSKARTTPMW